MAFLKNFHNVYRAEMLFLEQKLGELGLKSFQSKYITAICNRPGISQEEIANSLFVNKSNASRQLAVLEEEGYIERRAGEDKRVSLVYPTGKAIEIMPVIRAANAEWRDALTSGFSEDDKAVLSEFSEKLYDNVKKYLKDK